MKTISELNNKWWYRLIKVIYLAILLVAFIGYPIGIFFSYGPEYDNDKSYIKCANGKDFILSKNGIYLNSDYMYSSDKDKAESLCFDGTVNFTKDEFGKTHLRITSKTENSGKYELVNLYTGRNWIATVGFSLLSMFGVSLAFETMRRIFYYVILGSIKPKK